MMRNIYADGTYLENHPTWHEEDSPWKAEQIIQIIKRNHLNPTTVCEVGCGVGEVLKVLSRKLDDSIEYFGYEISPHAFQRCQGKSKHNLSFFLKDLFSEKEANFDIVMAIDVMEHVEDCFSFLRRLKNKGEYKILHIPLDLSVQTLLRVKPILKRRKDAGHIHCFIKETAFSLLEETGYDIVDSFYTSSSLELPNRGWRSSLLKIPRRLFFSINQDFAVRTFGGYSLLVLAR